MNNFNFKVGDPIKLTFTYVLSELPINEPIVVDKITDIRVYFRNCLHESCTCEKTLLDQMVLKEFKLKGERNGNRFNKIRL